MARTSYSINFVKPAQREGVLSRQEWSLRASEFAARGTELPQTKLLPLDKAVGTMGGQNNAVQTQGSLLRSLGAIEAVIECLRIPLQYVRPQKWKAHYGLGSDKKEALACARRLWPECTDFARVRDHNRAESALIGHFTRVTQA